MPKNNLWILFCQCNTNWLKVTNFSKAFDTVRHHSVMQGYDDLGIPDGIFNWISLYLGGHQHCTRFQNATSDYLPINAGVIQGSALGPISFITTVASLKPVHAHNSLIKYADDFYLIIPSSNLATTSTELLNIETWATKINLKLNRSKSQEIIFTRPRFKGPFPEPIGNIPRVKEIKILGVYLSHTLKVNTHVEQLIARCCGLMMALKRLRLYGLNTNSLFSVFNSVVLSRLMYAAPSWWGLASKADKDRLNALLQRSKKFGYYRRRGPTVDALVRKAETSIFSAILSDACHPLHQFLPAPVNHRHNLRTRQHNCRLPLLTDNYKRSFICRLLHDPV